MTESTDESDGNNSTAQTIQETILDTTQYSIAPNYDKAFLKNGRVTTISQLLENREANDTQNLTIASFQAPAKKPKNGTPFLFALLLRITVPATKTTDSNFSAFKKNRFDKKANNRATYKKCILLADLADLNQLTGVLLEESNEDHNKLFHRDLSLDSVSVGSLCAVLNPKIEGHQLKNGAWVITTNRPIEFLLAPDIPERPLRTEKIGHEIRYFSLQSSQIYLLPDDAIDPMKTKCNFHSCDRHNAKSIGNQSCGCWMQTRRNDTGPRNTVLMFTFYFQDSGNKIVKAADFSSLRTTKLLFKNQSILADIEMLQNNNVHEYIQDKWRGSVKHVNDNGGWTIVGWFIRATIDDEEKEENDETLLRTSVKINVSYLYPTNKSSRSIPDEHTINQSDIRKLISDDEDTSESNTTVGGTPRNEE